MSDICEMVKRSLTSSVVGPSGHTDRGPEIGQLTHRGGQSVLIAAGHADLGAVGGQLPGDRQPDSPARPGDDG